MALTGIGGLARGFARGVTASRERKRQEALDAIQALGLLVGAPEGQEDLFRGFITQAYPKVQLPAGPIPHPERERVAKERRYQEVQRAIEAWTGRYGARPLPPTLLTAAQEVGIPVATKEADVTAPLTLGGYGSPSEAIRERAGQTVQIPTGARQTVEDIGAATKRTQIVDQNTGRTISTVEHDANTELKIVNGPQGTTLVAYDEATGDAKIIGYLGPEAGIVRVVERPRPAGEGIPGPGQAGYRVGNWELLQRKSRSGAMESVARNMKTGAVVSRATAERSRDQDLRAIFGFQPYEATERGVTLQQALDELSIVNQSMETYRRQYGGRGGYSSQHAEAMTYPDYRELDERARTLYAQIKRLTSGPYIGEGSAPADDLEDLYK